VYNLRIPRGETTSGRYREMITRAFTCTGPYAVLIMLGIKRVENRSVLPVPDKGRCAVSCSKSFNAAEYGEFVRWASRALPAEEFERIPAWADVKDWPGKVVGTCDYAARTESAPYRGVPREAWDEGYPYWWELSNVVCFDRTIPCRGNVGMWQMPSALAEKVSTADSLASCVGEKVAGVEDAVRLFRAAIPLAGGNEGFFVLPLDDARCALSEPVLVSLGDSSTAVVPPGEVFAVAFKTGASAIVLAHNHPSGNTKPSVQDRELTAKFVALGDQLGIRVVDHLIVGCENEACSVEGRNCGDEI